jgi:hypothetical protein
MPANYSLLDNLINTHQDCSWKEEFHRPPLVVRYKIYEDVGKTWSIIIKRPPRSFLRPSAGENTENRRNNANERSQNIHIVLFWHFKRNIRRSIVCCGGSLEILRRWDKTGHLLWMAIEEIFHFTNFFVQLIPANGRHIHFAFPQRTLTRYLIFDELNWSMH